MRVIVRAWTKDGYHKDILVATEKQIWSHDAKLKGDDRGVIIDPRDFPEMERFFDILEGVCGRP